jgi:Spy/CpxP family protein refolding chaperone
MHKKITFLALLTVVVSGASFAFAQEMGESRMKGPGKMEQRDPAQMIQKRLDRLTQELNLTADQQAKIKDLLTKSAQEIKERMQSMQQQMRQAREKEAVAIKALLTADQQAKFEELKANRQQMRQEKKEPAGPEM